MFLNFFPVLLAVATCVFADVYMHNPRGSNNRLNERSANRNNGDRMFDSQVYFVLMFLWSFHLEYKYSYNNLMSFENVTHIFISILFIYDSIIIFF